MNKSGPTLRFASQTVLARPFPAGYTPGKDPIATTTTEAPTTTTEKATPTTKKAAIKKKPTVTTKKEN